MLIEIERAKMRETKNYCTQCKKFLFSTNQQGYLQIRKGLALATNGIEIDITCNCGEKVKVKLK